MDNIKKYCFSLFLTFIVLVIFLFIINGLFYLNVMNEAIYRFFKLIIMIISVFIGSFILGKKCENKGYLNGFSYGLIIVCLLFFLSIIFSKLQLKLLFYYLIIISSSTLGGTIGIRKKKTN